MAHALSMNVQVVDLDRIDGDAVITFSDGLTVRYTAALLREMIPQAEIIMELEAGPEE